MKRTFKYAVLAIIVFTIYCFIPSSPNQDLLDKLEELRLDYSGEKLNEKYSILIDYNKPIFKKRLWVIDNKTKEIVLNSFVSHAKKSGWIWFNKSSNEVGSKVSSVGVFKTLGTYESNYGKGKHKVGMQLKGLEKDKNNNVTRRNIVFHCSYGLWSEGCFMTSPKTNKLLIDLTKNGSLCYVNYN